MEHHETSTPDGCRSVHRHNATVWDAAAVRRDVWSTPVSSDEIAAASNGDWAVKLTPHRSVPADWFPPLGGLSLLGLASGGGQQCPIFASTRWFSPNTCRHQSPREPGSLTGVLDPAQTWPWAPSRGHTALVRYMLHQVHIRVGEFEWWLE
ncbi:MAG: hypothetical protein QNL12_04415 [Acidimicrobiia bacterium]|nr:hypothetical protein [Acidimicrobiia bacterium]MDX2466536.1 hypothetical protein [Acidimicrobiia bacterium]